MASEALKVKYLDVSTLVKFYVDEQGSKELHEFFNANKANFRTTWLCLAEALAALKSKWNGNQSKHEATKIDQDQYLEATCHLIIEWRKRIDIDDLDHVDPSVPIKVREISEKYNLDYSDALQLFTIKNGIFSSLAGDSASIFITADGPLASAAKSEGIRVWNCTTGPAPAWVY